MKTGIEIIAAERARQIVDEAFDSERDDKYVDNSLAKAGACYAMPTDEREKYESFTFSEPKQWFPRWWPKSWDVVWWKPTPDDRVKELAKAGALIAAEIDRLLRLKNKQRRRIKVKTEV